MKPDISVSVIIVAKNEAQNLPRCLSALPRFTEVIVVDSNSEDGTAEIARSFNVPVVAFNWDGAYPKKRQWALDNIPLKNKYVFFVDADEEVTPALCDEIARLNWSCAGYFIKGPYVLNGAPLRFGIKNQKLALFNPSKIGFPVVDDLDLPGMGEIEGHYQPVLKKGCEGERIGALKAVLLHHALDDAARYAARHDGYAMWERGMRAREAYPEDPVMMRRWMKRIFAVAPRAAAAFFHSYILKGGFLDGKGGLTLARLRYGYYKETD